MASDLMKAMFAEEVPNQITRIPIQSPTQSPTQLIDPVRKLLAVLTKGEKSASELRQSLKIKHRATFRSNYLHPALESGLIEHTIPERPSSRLQKYRITVEGRKMIDHNRD